MAKTKKENQITTIFNNYVIKDKQEIKADSLKTLPFLPLYLSNASISLYQKILNLDISFNNGFTYSCLLHNHTKKHLLKDYPDAIFKYKTIHTPTKTRYSKIKLDIYDKWLVIIPLSTYFKPYVVHHTNVTQSVRYFAFEDKKPAIGFLELLNQDYIKVAIYLTRFGNFNNLQVLKHLKIMNIKDANCLLNNDEKDLITKIKQVL